MRNARYYHSCFSVKENGVVTKVVVVGGFSSVNHSWPNLLSTEILDLKTNKWNVGPIVPLASSGNQRGEENSGPFVGFSVAGIAYK